MKELYLECYSGISGDMTVAALLDLGADQEVLQKVLESVPVKGFQVKISRVQKAGLDVCDFDVILDQEFENHDHDMEFLYGDHGHTHEQDSEHDHHHNHEHTHEHHHGHDHDHSHERTHEHHHHNEHTHSHSHIHRSLPDIVEILMNTEMTGGARAIAMKVFQILAEAESKAHGIPVDQVHFHEAGALDSIVDVIAAAVCLDNLNIKEVILPVLYEGMGSIRCQHGTLPVPVPAVLHIAEAQKLPLRIIQRNAELVTPTGAAIAAAIRTKDELPEKFTIIKSGTGAGKRGYEVPSLVRAMIIEPV